MSIDDIIKIECTYHDYDYEFDDSEDSGSEASLIGTINIVDRRIENNRLILTAEDEKEYYFPKTCSLGWFYENGHLLNSDKYPKEDRPYKTRILQ